MSTLLQALGFLRFRIIDFMIMRVYNVMCWPAIIFPRSSGLMRLFPRAGISSPHILISVT
jgi:hypothetical protein